MVGLFDRRGIFIFHVPDETRQGISFVIDNQNLDVFVADLVQVGQTPRTECPRLDHSDPFGRNRHRSHYRLFWKMRKARCQFRALRALIAGGLLRLT